MAICGVRKLSDEIQTEHEKKHFSFVGYILYVCGDLTTFKTITVLNVQRQHDQYLHDVKLMRQRNKRNLLGYVEYINMNRTELNMQ